MSATDGKLALAEAKAKEIVDSEEEHTRFHWWDGIRKVARVIVVTKLFENLILGAILANMVALSLYQPTEPDTSARNSALEDAEFVFTLIFTVELVLKMLAIGPREYFNNGFNHLDFLIVFFG